MIDAALVERYVRDANPIPHLDDVDADELAHAVAVTHARREAAMQTPTQTPTRPAPAVTPPQRGKAWAFALAIVLVLAGIGITALILRDGGGTVTDEPAPPTTMPETPTSVLETPTDPIQIESLTWDQVESLTWSRVADPDPRFEEKGGVAVGGPGLVAVGRGFWVSEDGMAWTQADPTLLGHPYATWGDVTAGGPGLVAVGVDWDWESSDPERPDRAAVWTSVDGLTWSQIAHDEQVFGPAPPLSGEGWTGMASVTVGGPGLVAVGWETSADFAETRAVIWNSPDGLTWSRVPHNEATFGDGGMMSVTAGGPGLVAVGGDAVWTSVDGLTWSRVPYDEQVFGSGAMTKVIAGGPGLVAIGSEELPGEETHAVIWTSPDGSNWSRIPHDDQVIGDAVMGDVIAIESGLVAVGSQWRCEPAEGRELGPGWEECVTAVVWTSPDGMTWSRVPHNEEAFALGGMSHVIAGGPGLVALGTVEIYPDGPVDMDGEAYDNGGMVWVAIPTE